jgi:hypothetical protein
MILGALRKLLGEGEGGREGEFAEGGVLGLLGDDGGGQAIFFKEIGREGATGLRFQVGKHLFSVATRLKDSGGEGQYATF